MKRPRPAYRIRQFWHALFAEPTEHGLSQVQNILTPSQLELFMAMPKPDQAHALRVLWTLHARREVHPDLMVAALLHDIGKARYPLKIYQRVLIVLGDWLFPKKVKEWGRSEPRGWRKPFVVACQHPAWSAEMAARGGASALSVSLIWRHQESMSIVPESIEDRLLRALQAADDDV